MSELLRTYIFAAFCCFFFLHLQARNTCTPCFLSNPGDQWLWNTSQNRLQVQWQGKTLSRSIDTLSWFARNYPNASNADWVAWFSTFTLPQPLPEPPKGFRVLIDPGHWAANPTDAKREGRLLPAQLPNGKQDTLYEAMLNLHTAFLLKDLLEEKGYLVQLTRNKPGSSLGMTFMDWFQNHRFQTLALALKEGIVDRNTAQQLKKTARPDRWHPALFHHMDLWYRIQKAKNFQPHVVISIHFNVGNQKAMADGSYPLTSENYAMAFIPGAMHPSEIESPLDMAAALRWHSTKLLDKSAQLAELFLQFTNDSLGVPPVSDQNRLFYLDKYTKKGTKTGIYHRNLAILRHSPYPIVLIEPLLQNNQKEFESLILQKAGQAPFDHSPRLWELAQTCFWTIEAYKNQTFPTHESGP